MEPITNSKIKEAMRQKNESEARNLEYQINVRVNNEMNQIRYKKQYEGSLLVMLALAGGIIFAAQAGFGGFVGGAALGAVVFYFLNQQVKENNKKIDVQKQNLRAAGDLEIRNAYAAADEKTRREMKAYDNEVNISYQKIMKNPDIAKGMLDQNTVMFQRMISHADAGSYMRFVETDFIYKVEKTRIAYYYRSDYSNPRDDYTFYKERLRDLKTDAECEGLAKALAKLTIHRMKKAYPPNSLNITVSHNDALVTLHFKAANKNFRAAKDIL